MLDGEALRRAVHGVDEPLVSMGKLVRDAQGQPLTIKRYSDTLLIKLLATRHPKYKEARRVELTGPGGGPVQVAHVREHLEAKLATMAARLHWPAVPSASDEPGADVWGEQP